MLGLYYEENGHWQLLPTWATFYYGLGLAIGRNPARGTVVVLTPECAGTMPFIALGAVAGRWPGNDGGGQTKEEHWRMLTRLRPGTPVSYTVLKKGGRQLKHARLRMIGVRPTGEIELAFRPARNQDKPLHALVKYPEEARRIAPLRVPPREFRPDQKTMEYEIAPVLDVFVRDRLYDYVVASQPDCLLLGNESQLRAECELMLGSPGGTPLGTIAEALRLRDGNGRTWHTLICPLRGHTPVPETFNTVIFDGPSAWLRHRGDYATASQVVVATHTNPALPELLSELRATFRDGAAPFDLRGQVPAMPTGMEIIAFLRQ